MSYQLSLAALQVWVSMLVAEPAGCESFDDPSEYLVSFVIFSDVHLSLSHWERWINYPAAYCLTHDNGLVLHDCIGPEPQPYDSGGVEASAASSLAADRIEPLGLDVPLAGSHPTKLDSLLPQQLRNMFYYLLRLAGDGVDNSLRKRPKCRTNPTCSTRKAKHCEDNGRNRYRVFDHRG
jgi:hypothetical protein